MNIKTIIISLLLCFIVKDITAQEYKKRLFKKGDRICFIGNSITHNGEYHHNILQFFVTRYPNTPINSYNAGIKGDVTSGIIKRIHTDILIHKPTHAIIMIGMNDVQRELYGKNLNKNADTLAKQKAALDVYTKNLDSIIVILKQKKIQVILQKPSAYDQTSAIKYVNGLGINDALIACGDIMQQLANMYKLPIVDYNTIMTRIAVQQQTKIPNFTLTINDRVHPNGTGHFIMAYQFITTFNRNSIISKTVIDVNKVKSNAANKNCIVSNSTFKSNTLQFTLLENALPYPIVENQQQGLTLVPFTNKCNNQILIVKNLPKGNYLLKIDNFEVAIFSNEIMQKGINLATYKHTPQYIQALKVRGVLEKLWENEGIFRAVAFVEHMYLQNFENKNNMSLVKPYLDSLYNSKFKELAYFANAFEKYITYKTTLSKLLLQADSLRKEVYKVAQPTSHTFSLKNYEEPNVATLIEASQSTALPLVFGVQQNYLVKDVANFESQKEYYIRNGLPNFFKKINQTNAKLTIGFLGGSITKANDQYRNQTLAFIQTLNPKAKIKGINAGVSGTGTELGCCRVGEQILQYQPDLVFVEFAVNGGSNEAMEGIVRQIKKHNSQTDICFIYTIAGDQYKQYAQGEVPNKIQGFEKVASHYGIPSVHMGLYASLLQAQEKLV